MELIINGSQNTINMVVIIDLIKKWHIWIIECFMREKQWEFEIRNGFKYFKKTVEKNITIVPKYYFGILPIDFTKREGIYGFIEDEIIKIRLRPRKISLKGLLATSSGCNFIGKIHHDYNRTLLKGSYRDGPLLRLSNILMLYTCFFITLTYPLVIFVLLIAGNNKDLIILLLLQMCFSFILFVAIFLGNKIQEFFNADERKEIYNFLLECSKK